MNKNKIWTRVAFTLLLLGWFPYMWISIYGSSHKEAVIWILFFGLFLSFTGSLMMLPILRNNDLFKKIDELEDERIKYYETRKRLEQKISEL